MGQQQLLLIILVSIIVGIATIVAITTFGAASDQANLDAVRADMVSAGAYTQSFYRKPTALGGGGRDFRSLTFFDIPFPTDSISSDGLTAYNSNGTYSLDVLAETYINLSGVPTGGSGAELHAEIYENDMVWFEPPRKLSFFSRR